MAAAEFTDLYEILQVSPNAEKDTIKRVHQLLSLKYQLAAPENNAVAYFAQLQEAAATLLDSQTRAAYDLERLARQPVPVLAPSDAPAPVRVSPPAPPVAAPVSPVAVVGTVGDLPLPVEPTTEAGALNAGRFREGLDIKEQKRRRAGLMEICYQQRILKPRMPALSMKQLEDGMALTVHDLEGPLWYLKETDLIRVSDAGNYAVSVRGMNAIEAGLISFAECRFDYAENR